MIIHYVFACPILVFITLFNLFYIRNQLCALGELNSRSAQLQKSSYLGHDYPESLPLLGTVLESVIPTITEESVHYPVLGNASDAEWFSLTSEGYGYVRLGENNRLFMVTMFHEMHCLRVLNKAFSKHPVATPGHIQHCLNYLRQGTLCSPDLSLEPGNFEEKNFVVERTGATHMCKDWEVVYEAMSESMSRWMRETSVATN